MAWTGSRLVATLVDVPVALVSLLERDRQVFPGMVGLQVPWGAARQTPLSYSLCRHVVSAGEPLVLTDARLDARGRDSLATSDLGVVGYAGMPLLDSDGLPLGSLCASDTRPRQWTDAELSVLEDLAAACSAELQLRIVSRRHQRALAAMEAARARADDAVARYRNSFAVHRPSDRW
ncbi:GAF domain-containing protein [Streptomyces sp. NPDC005529]|uniref:GAF domain-containing protein n=1 Tax=unclassified Streptomyces TaxID=2593676 RepID=UPI0036CA3236